LLGVADGVLTALELDLAGSDAAVVLADAEGRIIGLHGHDRVARSRLDRLGVAPGFVWGEEQGGTTPWAQRSPSRRQCWWSGTSTLPTT
jgi:transcriptional regulator of acetoin/glycerol metabolism